MSREVRGLKVGDLVTVMWEPWNGIIRHSRAIIAGPMTKGSIDGSYWFDGFPVLVELGDRTVETVVGLGQIKVG